MTAGNEELDLKDRLSLIETMIGEGRRTTNSSGWIFVLWGITFYVVEAWEYLYHYALAWPITVISASVLMGIIAWRKRGNRPGTTIGRVIWSIWIAMGISALILFDALGFSMRMDDHIFIAVFAAMLGTTNAASGMILKWKLQFTCALVWWAAAVVSCFGTESQTMLAFLAAIFLCQIVFGIYLMIAEVRQCGTDASHA